MASRALGAFLALAAAAAIVVSIASSAWWAGAPVIDGKLFEAKYVHAGPLGANGCNVGGDGSCEPITIDQTVQLVGYAELGAAALATLFLFVLLSAALRVSEHRRGIATTSLLFTLLAGAGGGALLALGPGIAASQVVEVPIGWGTFAFGGGIVASLLASLITRRLEPEPLRLKPSPNAPQSDVHAVMRGIPRDAVYGNGQPLPIVSPTAPTVMTGMTAPQPAGRASPFPASSPRIQANEAQGASHEHASSPRIRAPHEDDRSSPRVAPSAWHDDDDSLRVAAPPWQDERSSPRHDVGDDAVHSFARTPPRSDEPVNPYARTKPPSDAPSMTSSPRIRPPQDNAAGSQRIKSPSEQPPFGSAQRGRPDDAGGSQRIKSPSEQPNPRDSAPHVGSSSNARDSASRIGSPSNASDSASRIGPSSNASDSARVGSSGNTSARDSASRIGSSNNPSARVGSPSSARDSASRIGSPSNTADSSRVGSPSNAGRDSEPRVASPSSGDSGPRTKSPSDAPPPGASSSGDMPAPASRAGALGVAALLGKPGDAPRTKAPSAPPGLPGVKPLAIPSIAKPPVAPPNAPAANPRVKASTIPPASPTRPDARTKPPSIPPVRPVVPSPVRSGKAIVVPEHLRAGTEQGTPPPSHESGVVGANPTGIAPPPTQHKTIAHAVPPMPVIDGDSRRAQTENDDSLDQAMRPTDFITAVEIDHEAKAAAHARAAAAAEAADEDADDDDVRDDDDDDD
ncbi:MAG TPA: hypothetical protein VIV40_00680, partial [Kofleriaceae bacterium]